jgi:hypothetical protein
VQRVTVKQVLDKLEASSGVQVVEIKMRGGTMGRVHVEKREYCKAGMMRRERRSVGERGVRGQQAKAASGAQDDVIQAH